MGLFLSKERKEQKEIIKRIEKQFTVDPNHITRKPSYNLYRKLSAKYYSGMDDIESMWSVISNLNLYNTEKGDILLEKCRQNLRDLDEMLRVGKELNMGDIPPHVPAYVRMAMLYEKREEYEKGIKVCVHAISRGAISDGSKTRMYGRLARLIRKSGIQPTEEMIKMINMK